MTTTATEPSTAPRVEVLRVTDEHVPGLAEFYRAVGWDAEATADSVRRGRATAARDNLAEPGADVPAFAFLLDDRVVGYISTIPVRFWDGSAERPGHWLKGLMVHPEHRNGPIGYLVLKEAVRHLGLAGAMVVAEPARKLFTAVRCGEVGVLSNRILPLRPGRMLRLLDGDALGLERITPSAPRLLRFAQRTGLTIPVGALMQLGLRARASVVRVRDRDRDRDRELDVALGPLPSAGELDRLWEEVRSGLGAAVVRNAAYLSWRYGRTSDPPYRFVTVREAGRLVGLGVVREPRLSGDARLHGIRVATLSDAIFSVDRPGIGVAIALAAARAARDSGGDALLASASHPVLDHALKRAGYLSFPGNLHFHLRPGAEGASLPEEAGRWWMTRGDSDADAVF